MKQLFAVGAVNAQPTVKAASHGLTAEQLHTALQSAGYSVPTNTDRPKPTRLALVRTASAGRMLTHVAADGDRFFAHALLNVPASADAQHAIQTWGSPNWQRQELDTTADLPELPYLPVADILDDDSLKAWLDSPSHRELLEFSLHGLLGTHAQERVILFASADDVAKVVYAVTRVLPPNLLDEFTFSTFEPQPLACSARLIGSEPPLGDDELSGECFTQAVAFHPASGRKSTIAADVPFAAFAVDCLASGQYSKLDDVKAQWQRLGLTDAKQFDLVFRLTRGTGTMTKLEATEALKLPALATWVSSRSDALNTFLDWALEDRTFASDSFSKAIQTQRQKPEVLAKLATVVRESGVESLKKGETTRAETAFEVLLPMVAPSKAAAIWNELFSIVGEPSGLPWETRCYLLPRLVRAKHQASGAAIDPSFAKWLQVPAEKLGSLLTLDLPKAYHLAGARSCLVMEGEPSHTFVKTIAAHPKLTLAVLEPHESVSEDVAVKLYAKLLAEMPSHAWFEETVASANQYPKVRLNRFFEATIEAGKVDTDRVIRTQGNKLLELFGGQSGLETITKLFLANPPSDLLHAPSVLEFLGKQRQIENLSNELKSRIDAIQVIRSFLDGPSFTSEAMKPVAAAFAVSPSVVPSGAKSDVFHAVTASLAKRADSPEFQANLETTLVELGSTLANDATDLYENVLRQLRTVTDFARSQTMVQSFLALALGGAQSPELVDKLSGLDGQAFALASDAAKRGGNKMLDAVNAHAESWPREVRTKWGFLLAAVRPQSRWQRDVICASIGAFVMLVMLKVLGL